MLRVPRQVLVYLFRRTGKGTIEFLLLKRTKHHGGFWQGVSGAPEWGESDADGAAREVLEETGFSVAESLEPIDLRYELHREGDPDEAQWERLYGPDVHLIPEEVYVAEVPGDADPVLAPDEHDAFRWCSPDEARRLLTWRNNRHALEAAREFIAARRGSTTM